MHCFVRCRVNHLQAVVREIVDHTPDSVFIHSCESFINKRDPQTAGVTAVTRHKRGRQQNEIRRLFASARINSLRFGKIRGMPAVADEKVIVIIIAVIRIFRHIVRVQHRILETVKCFRNPLILQESAVHVQINLKIVGGAELIDFLSDRKECLHVRAVPCAHDQRVILVPELMRFQHGIDGILLIAH